MIDFASGIDIGLGTLLVKDVVKGELPVPLPLPHLYLVLALISSDEAVDITILGLRFEERTNAYPCLYLATHLIILLSKINLRKNLG